MNVALAQEACVAGALDPGEAVEWPGPRGAETEQREVAAYVVTGDNTPRNSSMEDSR